MISWSDKKGGVKDSTPDRRTGGSQPSHMARFKLLHLRLLIYANNISTLKTHLGGLLRNEREGRGGCNKGGNDGELHLDGYLKRAVKVCGAFPTYIIVSSMQYLLRVATLRCHQRRRGITHDRMFLTLSRKGVIGRYHCDFTQ